MTSREENNEKLNFLEIIVFPQTKRSKVRGSFSLSVPGLVVDMVVPERAPDKKKSVLVRTF